MAFFSFYLKPSIQLLSELPAVLIEIYLILLDYIVHRKELLVQAPVEQFNGQLASDCDKRRAFKPILTDITSNRPQEIYKQLLFDTFSEETFDLMLDTLLVHHVGDFDSLIKRMKIIQTIKLQQCTVARESSSVIVQ